MERSQTVSTGFPALDNVIQHLRMGDNVVFQVRDIEMYKKFVTAFLQTNKDSAKKIIYICFTQHAPLLRDSDGIEIFSVNADSGFEEFCSQIHDKITHEGRDVFYIFDCLSELLDRWATDSMIGNFFKVTCPYLYELNTIAYFATFKNHNSFHTTAVIRDTTQVLFDIFQVGATSYVYPLKVWNRYTPTLFLPHAVQENRYIPVTSSGDVAALYTQLGENDENPERDLDYWDRLFIKARELLASTLTEFQIKEHINKLSKIFLTKDERILDLISVHFSLQDIISIKSRLIGSGYIGGKAVGMLLARKILYQSSEGWQDILEPHDSFYIGSDVYYSFLVENNLWKLKMELRRTTQQNLEGASYLREKILQGQFNDRIKNKFLRMLEYFGQSPIIVRSSSLLEDGFGNAFPGKYESVFCINQGTLDERYNRFTEAVREVFASTLSEEALAYREKHGLTHSEEQMALLVQRVSGSNKRDYFFPDIAGVGFSYNTYVWDSQISPRAGMVRLVVGLGTRAVNRLEGDYARIAALDKPHCIPYDGLRSFKAFTQQKIDVLNIRHNRQECLSIQDLLDQSIDLHQAMTAERDYEAEAKIKQLGLKRKESWVFSFNPLFSNTNFSSTFSILLQTLETAYCHPVDIEFTVNFNSDGKYRINLLQCRPLQVQGLQKSGKFLPELPPNQILFQSKGCFMGGNLAAKIHKVIFVEPHAYNLLSQSDKYEVARIIGRLNQGINKETMTVLLLGPGRWGSRIPSLGVPVAFAEFNQISILGEIGYHNTGFLPDVSFGTHFFQDMIESEIFYLALFPEKKETIYQLDLLQNFTANSYEMIPEKSNLRNVVKVYNTLPGKPELHLISDITKQEIICFFADPD